MDDTPLDCEDPGWFPPQGNLSPGNDATKDIRDSQVDLYPAVCGNEGSGTGRRGDVRPTPPEYFHREYQHSDNTGAMSGGESDGQGRRC